MLLLEIYFVLYVLYVFDQQKKQIDSLHLFVRKPRINSKND